MPWLFLPASVRWDPQKNLYRVVDQDQTVWIFHRQRLGLVKSATGAFETMAKKYGLDMVGSLDNQLVIDVGADAGLFSMAAQLRGAKVHSFEPDPQSFTALRENAKLKFINIYPAAVSAKSGPARFFLAGSSGDSSLLEPDFPVADISVEAITLDDWAQKNIGSTEKVALLKVEAEGGEPEALLGAESLLTRVDWVSVDVSPERPVDGGGGGERERISTLPEVTNLLARAGFEMHYFSPSHSSALFRSGQISRQRLVAEA